MQNDAVAGYHDVDFPVNPKLSKPLTNMNMQPSYTRVAIVLHWVIAALLLGNIALGLSVDLLPDNWVRPTVDTHKSIGITVLGLFILRILWRLTHRPPQLPQSFAKWERISAHIVHGGLYVLIVAMPLTGWIHDSAWKDAATHPMKLFYAIPWPRIPWITQLDPDTKESMHAAFGQVHANLAYFFYVLFALHVLGALKHQWIDRESVLRRIGVGR